MMTTGSENKQTVFGPDCCIQGQLNLNQNALILGTIDGTCRSSGTIIVGKGAQIKGLLVVGDIIIHGQVDADIIVYGQAQIKTGAIVRGRIFAGSIAIEQDIDMKVELQVGNDVIADVEKLLLEETEISATADDFTAENPFNHKEQENPVIHTVSGITPTDTTSELEAATTEIPTMHTADQPNLHRPPFPQLTKPRIIGGKSKEA